MLQRWVGGLAPACTLLAHLFFFCKVLLSLAIDLKYNERFTIQCTLKLLRIWMHENCWQQTKSYLNFLPGTLHDPSSSSSSSSSLVAMLLLLLRSPVVVPYLEREEKALMQMLQAPHHDNISRGIFFSLFFREFQRKLQSIVIQEHPVLV